MMGVYNQKGCSDIIRKTRRQFEHRYDVIQHYFVMSLYHLKSHVGKYYSIILLPYPGLR